MFACMNESGRIITIILTTPEDTYTTRNTEMFTIWCTKKKNGTNETSEPSPMSICRINTFSVLVGNVGDAPKTGL